MCGLRSDQQPRVPPSVLLTGLSQSLRGKGTTSLCCSSARLPYQQCTTSWQQVPQRQASNSGAACIEHFVLLFAGVVVGTAGGASSGSVNSQRGAVAIGQLGLPCLPFAGTR